MGASKYRIKRCVVVRKFGSYGAREQAIIGAWGRDQGSETPLEQGPSLKAREYARKME